MTILIDKKIASNIAKVSRSSLQNISYTVESGTKHSGFDRDMPKCISPVKRLKIIDNNKFVR